LAVHPLDAIVIEEALMNLFIWTYAQELLVGAPTIDVFTIGNDYGVCYA
jgi:hypothetical protein